MSLSVIVISTPGQALTACLELLARQSLAPVEVLVVTPADQAGICASFAARLPLKQIESSGDPAGDFNLALAQATGTSLVSLTASTLLNPRALASFVAYARNQPEGLAFGYYPDDGSGLSGSFCAPSRLLPDLEVAWLDSRFKTYSRQGLEASDQLARYPHWFASESNLCLSRARAQALGGLSPGLPLAQAWARLAWQWLTKGGRVDFLIDAWAERLPDHDDAKRPEARELELPLAPLAPPATARILGSQQGLREIASILDDYALKDAAIEAAQRERLAQPKGKLRFGSDPYVDRARSLYYRRPTSSRPAFLVIGTQKGGTGSLYRYLSSHPRLNPSQVKEIHYFDYDDRYAWGTDWYLDHFFFEPDRLCYESTASYLFGEKCSTRIFHIMPDVKLIAILRDPVKRFFSAWKMYQRRVPDPEYYRRKIGGRDPMPEPRSLEEVMDQELSNPTIRGYYARGRYAEQISYYLRYYDRSRLLLLDFDELANDPMRLLARCAEFIGIENDFRLPARIEAFNTGNYQDKMPAHLAERLEAYYAEDKRRLREEFGLDFAWLK